MLRSVRIASLPSAISLSSAKMSESTLHSVVEERRGEERRKERRSKRMKVMKEGEMNKAV